MKIHSVICDQCGKEMVIESQYPSHTGLHLSEVDHNINKSGTKFLLHITPKLGEPKDFCDMQCLKAWVANR